jgi:mRNA interferase HigB
LEVALHVISRKRLLEASQIHGNLAEPLDLWYRIAKHAGWKSLDDLRQTFPSADRVGKHTVFNIKGNSYRLIVEINYITGRVYIRHVLTHAEYDKGGWKK